jgi:diguanylate cyclase (GGDEF)-like protein
MYTFIQLFIKNLLAGVLILIAISAVSLFTLKNLVAEQQSYLNSNIPLIINNLSSPNDAIHIASTLRMSNDYQVLTIKDFDNNSLYKLSNKNDSLQFNLLATPISTIKLAEYNLIIDFQLNTGKVTQVAIYLLASLWLFILVLLFIISLKNIQQEKTLFSRICSHIKQEMLQFSNVQDERSATQKLTLDIPELTQGINDIKSLLDENENHAKQLKSQAYIDTLTGVANRNKFIQFFQSKIAQSDEIAFGIMLIARCSQLQTINQVHGFKDGDKYIKDVANIIKGQISSYQGAELFRLNSSDFSVIIPNITLKEAKNFAQNLTGNFNSYQQSSDLDSVAYSGLVSFDNQKPLGELLAIIDTAISVAQTQSINSWYAQTDTSLLNNPSANYGNQNWRQEIEDVIESKRIVLHIQPIQPLSHKNKLYSEVLARFMNSSEQILPTASFIAMAEKLDKIIAVDRLVVECLINEIKIKNLTENQYGINISSKSIHDENFLIWLERYLLREHAIAGKLIFEVTESGLQQNVKISRRFIDMIHRVGARVTVERFGVGLTSFKFFKELKPDFIKMDSSYTRDIDEDKNNQYFIRVIVDLAHRLSIGVLTECIETLEEKHTLEQLFIDGCQGYYVGKPEPI